MHRLICESCGAPLRGSVCDYCGSRYSSVDCEIEIEPAIDYKKVGEASSRMFDRKTQTWVWRATRRPDPLGTVVTN